MAKKETFRNKLFKKLLAANIGLPDMGTATDGSGSWVTLHKKNLEIVFSFDCKGEKLEGIAVYEDVVQVVDQKRLIAFENLKEE